MLVPVNGLSAQRQHQLLAQASVIDYRRGQFVFCEGERDNFAFFLLEGELDLLAHGQLVKHIVGGTPGARYALAQLQPRQLSARAKGPVNVLRIDRNLLDKLLALDGSCGAADVEVRGIEVEDDDDWMTRMLQSELFARVPAANIQRIFTKLEPVSCKAGDVVVQQDDPGDYYYIIQEGRCEVSRCTASGKIPIKLAELGPGDAFGEEALVADSKRNATVAMLSDGELMRLTKADFIELIKKPLLSAVSYADGSRLVAERGAKWLDVRFPEELEQGGIGGSINQPLNTLRMHSQRLDRAQCYIVCCDSGARSAVGAFLLSERGFNVHCLEGGLLAYGLLDARLDEPAGAGGSPADLACDDALELFDDEADLEFWEDRMEGTDTVKATRVAAIVPASHQSEEEQIRTGTYEAMVDESSVVDADIKVQALRTELAKANLQLDEARRAKEQAEAAKLESEQSVSKRLQTEREKLVREAEQARQVWEEAQRLKAESERAQQEARVQTERERNQRTEELAEANRQSEEAKRLKEEAEAAKKQAELYAEQRLRDEEQKLAAEEQRAREIWEEAERLKKELELEKRRAEEEAERRHRKQEERIQDMQAEAERRMCEEQKKLEESYAWQAEELARLKQMKEEAENQLCAERDRLQIESEEARNRLTEAKRIQREVEQAKLESTREAERREQRQLELESKLRDEINAKVDSERRKLEAEFAHNAEELERARLERDAAEAARLAAADEAERIIREYKETHEMLRQRQEDKLRTERERLENEANRLSEMMKETERAKENALATQRESEAQMKALKASRADHMDAAGTITPQLASEIVAVTAELTDARAKYAVADQAHRNLEKAALTNQYHLDEQRDEETHAHKHFEQEIEDWLREQDKALNSDLQQQILANQRSHLERIKKRAQTARQAAKAHDQQLIEELANKLRET